MALNKTFCINSNWSIAGSKTLNDTITSHESTELNPVEEVSLESIVTLESCVQLERKCNEPCSLDLKILSTTERIKVLNIVSESKYIEVYTGVIKEYCSTYKAHLVDDFDGTVVYRVQITLEEPIAQCTLKFIKCALPDSLWIYGINVIYTAYKKLQIFENACIANSSPMESNCENKLLKYCRPSYKDYKVSNKETTDPNKVNLQNNLLHDIKKMLDEKYEEIIISKMKEHIDKKFLELERVMAEKFKIIENNQHHLTEIIDMLHTSVIGKGELSNKVNK